jgi:hypothetical protein
MYGQTSGKNSITSEKWGLATSKFDVSKTMYGQGLRVDLDIQLMPKKLSIDLLVFTDLE